VLARDHAEIAKMLQSKEEKISFMSTTTSATTPESSKADGRQEWQFISPDQHIGTASLAIIIFYSVSGGPFGLEISVQTAGFLFSILGFMIVPIVYAVPEALMTAELASAFQEASGGVAWAEEAFGSAVGWVAGKNTLFAGVSNCTYEFAFVLLFVFGIHSSLTSNSLDSNSLSVLSSCCIYSIALGILATSVPV
jgi:amino acid transporter